MYRKLKTATTLLLMLLAIGHRVAFAQAMDSRQAGPPPLKLKVGDVVPDFTLQYWDGTQMKDISLHDFRGKKNVLIGFFVFAFTGG